jgi:hypothetical protein
MRLEAYSIAGMAHGVPLATAGADACWCAGPFFSGSGHFLYHRDHPVLGV